MISIRVHFEDGNTITTSINGTRPEIEAYYVGKRFQFGDTEECQRDKMVKAVRVEYLENDYMNGVSNIDISQDGLWVELWNNGEKVNARHIGARMLADTVGDLREYARQAFGDHEPMISKALKAKLNATDSLHQRLAFGKG